MEARGAIMHNGVYGSVGLDGDLEDVQNACEGYFEGYYAGVGAYITGDNLAWTGSDYWEERHCLLYTSPSPRDKRQSRMPSSA